MPLFRRLPKRGFKSITKNHIAILNLSNLQRFFDEKKIDLKDNLNLKLLQSKKIVSKKYHKLKILGKGEIKTKANISTNYISKQAKDKIEKIGGKLTLVKKLDNMSSEINPGAFSHATDLKNRIFFTIFLLIVYKLEHMFHYLE